MSRLYNILEKCINPVKIAQVSAATGSIPANSSKEFSIPIANVPTGYSAICAVPEYTGDDQFCVTGCRISGSNVLFYVRNCSSAADSGTARVNLICTKS